MCDANNVNYLKKNYNTNTNKRFENKCVCVSDEVNIVRAIVNLSYLHEHKYWTSHGDERI